MRRRSFATAVVCVLPLFSVPTAGSAQSVLERVLGQVENSTNLAPVNGVYANIAESVETPVSIVTTQTEVPPFTVVADNTVTLEDGTYLLFFSDEFPPDVFGGYSTPPTPGYDIGTSEKPRVLSGMG